MRFGRVEGVVTRVVQGDQPALRLTVYLETAHRLRIVREEIVPLLRPVRDAADLAWHADQYTQETIGVQLAEEGWEPIGAGEIPSPEEGELARSATYAVRQFPGGSAE
jgi:hypothetical protein